MEINRNTYEEYLLLYIDGELDPAMRQQLEEFVAQHPDLQEELSLLTKSVFQPDENVVFENKEALYRHEDEEKAVPIRWWRIAAAAVVVFTLATAGWIFMKDRPEKPEDRPVAEAKKSRVTDSGNKRETSIDEAAKLNENTPDGNTPVDLPEKKPVEKTAIQPDQSIRKEKAPARKLLSPPVQDHPQPESSPSAVDIETPDTDIAVNDTDPSNEQALQTAAVNPDLHPATTDKSGFETAVHEPSAGTEYIYFANTAVPKRTVLRGVFRKATRLLDKMTPL